MTRLAAIFDVQRLAHREDVLNTRRRYAELRRIDSAFDLRDDKFVALYRLRPRMFEDLCDELQPFLKPHTRVNEIPLSTKILTALSFYATGSYQTIVGHSDNMSQQSASRAINEVTEALNAVQITAKYIRFPQCLEERNKIKQGFFQKFKVPCVVGCIDGTHVALIRPWLHEKRYFNRKHYHSLNVQVISDSDLNITSVDASHEGRTHDSHIWNVHPVKQHMAELTARGESCWLLGDSGYAQREYMMTPIIHTEPGTAEELYDQIQKSARNTVERTFGVLKGRWRCLLAARELHYEPIKSAKIVNACCVLHNLCNRARLEFDELTPREMEIENRLQEYAQPRLPRGEGPAQGRELREGRDARARQARNLWTAAH